MADYPLTPLLGLKRPIVGTGQQWSTQKYIVDNFDAVESFGVLTDGRLDQIDRVTNPAAAGDRLGVTPKGTSADRDNWFNASLALPADRVAFANRIPRWFNTDAGKGWEERYYSAYGDAGMTRENSRAAAGWYQQRPVQAMFYQPASILPNGAVISMGALVAQAPHANTSPDHARFFTATASSGVKVLNDGLYMISFGVQLPSAVGTTRAFLQIDNNATPAWLTKRQPFGVAEDTAMMTTGPWYYAADSFITPQIFQFTGASITMTGAAVEVTYLGAKG